MIVRGLFTHSWISRSFYIGVHGMFLSGIALVILHLVFSDLVTFGTCSSFTMCLLSCCHHGVFIIWHEVLNNLFSSVASGTYSFNLPRFFAVLVFFWNGLVNSFPNIAYEVNYIICIKYPFTVVIGVCV